MHREYDFSKTKLGAVVLLYETNAGAQIRLSVRRVYVSLSSAYPYQQEFLRVLSNLRQAYPQLA